MRTDGDLVLCDDGLVHALTDRYSQTFWCELTDDGGYEWRIYMPRSPAAPEGSTITCVACLGASSAARR